MGTKVGRPKLSEDAKLQYSKVGMSSRLYKDFDALSAMTGLSIPMLIRLALETMASSISRVNINMFYSFPAGELNVVVESLKKKEEKTFEDRIFLQIYKNYIASGKHNYCSLENFIAQNNRALTKKQDDVKKLNTYPVNTSEQLLKHRSLLLNKYMTAIFYSKILDNHVQNIANQGDTYCKLIGVANLSDKEVAALELEYKLLMKTIVYTLSLPEGMKLTNGNLGSYLSQLEDEYNKKIPNVNVTLGYVLKQFLMDQRPSDYSTLCNLKFDIFN